MKTRSFFASATMLLVAGPGLIDCASAQKPSDSNTPAPNPYLAAEHYATTHFDPSQSDLIPYEVPRGTFRIDLRRQPRVQGGPVNIMTLASTSPDYMWGASTAGISYIDCSNGGWKEVARYNDPNAKLLPEGLLDSVLAIKYTSMPQVENLVFNTLGINFDRIRANIYVLTGANGMMYSTNLRTIRAYRLIDPKKPAAGIEQVYSIDLTDQMRPAERKQGVQLVMTYDGNIAAIGKQSLRVLSPELEVLSTVELGEDEMNSNSAAVDEKNGIYVATDKYMYKVVWTGSKLSMSEADGAWKAAYDYGDQQPPSVKVGRGTGSTPTLMGFGDNEDKLVVITDGSDRMKIVAFWRDAIPADAKQVQGAKSPRIAGQLELTCGLPKETQFVQSEQSVVVNGYGAFIVNNIRPEGVPDRMVDVFAGGPVLEPSVGVERVQWNTNKNRWESVWTRGDVISTSMVPCMSGPSNVVFINGYTKADGWEVTGLDWNTGKTVHRTIFGQDNLGNGAYAILQFLPDGDMLFNSIGGPTRIKLK